MHHDKIARKCNLFHSYYTVYPIILAIQSEKHWENVKIMSTCCSQNAAACNSYIWFSYISITFPLVQFYLNSALVYTWFCHQNYMRRLPYRCKDYSQSGKCFCLNHKIKHPAMCLSYSSSCIYCNGPFKLWDSNYRLFQIRAGVGAGLNL